VSARVRALSAADIDTFLDLIDALADYERLPRPDAEARQRLAKDALADPPRFSVLLAEANNDVVGYAVYFFTYSTFLARPTLYLEDLFVTPAARGKGAGLALFRACVAEAVRNDCGRMEWQVLTWNTPSIDFYERLGARRLADWHGFRLDQAGLAAIAAKPDSQAGFSPHGCR
jgi:GNAT superfamily N-acetyltransferase